MMKRYLMLLLFFVLFIPTENFSQVKRVLLEQHTGAWCGWCVDGSYIMEQILEEYPDKVIGVKVHNGDSMAIPEQQEIAGALGLTGYPTAAIDRKNLGGKIFQNRGDWKALCETAMAEEPKVDIVVNYNLNTETRQLVAKVRVTMLEQVNLPLRFNLWVIEDSCSGEGKGWDQSNYLSGRPGYEDNPYYNLPSVIKGYQHVKVVRAMLGGAWGVKGSFVQPAMQGKIFEQEFSMDIDENYNLDHLSFVGMVQVESTNDHEILNCAKGLEGEASIQLTTEGPRKSVIETGTPFKKVFTLKNIASEEKTFALEVKQSERTPEDWVSSITVNNENVSELTLGSGEEADIELSLTPGDTLGSGDANLIVSEKDNPDSFKGFASITCFSKEIENFHINNPGEAQYSILDNLNNAGEDVFVNFASSDFNEFKDQFPNVKTLVWNSGATEAPTAEDIKSIMDANDAGINVFVCGNQAVSALGNNNALPAFGADYAGWSTQGYGSAPWRVWLSGYGGSPIGNDLGPTIEGNLIKYLITLMQINNASIAAPFMHFKYDGTRVLHGDTIDTKAIDAIFGVACRRENARAVILSITPHVIVNADIRQKMIDNILAWMKNTGPELYLNLGLIRFGDVMMGDEKDVTVAMMNSGQEDVVIDDIKLTGGSAYVFSMNDDFQFPLTIEPDGYETFKISFNPTSEALFNAVLNINSNSELNKEIKVQVEGRGTVSGVNDLIYNDESVELVPNPATDFVNLKFTEVPTGSYTVSIYNSAGVLVKSIQNKNMNSNILKINIGDLSSGAHYLKIDTDKDKIVKQLNIVR